MEAELQATLQSDGWTRTMRPTLEGQQHAAMNQLTVVEGARPEPRLSDDFLRGYYQAMSFAINRWEQILNEKERASRPEPEEPSAAGSPYESS